MQADFLPLWMLYFAIGLYCYLLAEYTKQWLLVYLDEGAVYWLPEAIFGLENILQTRVLLLRLAVAACYVV